MSYLNVIPASNTVIEDSSSQYNALGYDTDSNLVKNLTDSVTWSTDDPGGSITVDGIYTAGSNPSPPNRYVKAEYNTMLDSGEVTILSSGQLNHVHIELADGTEINDTVGQLVYNRHRFNRYIE